MAFLVRASCSSVAELKAALPVLVVEAYSKEHFKSTQLVLGAHVLMWW